MAAIDSLIAATALAQPLHSSPPEMKMTSNMRIAILNPWFSTGLAEMVSHSLLWTPLPLFRNVVEISSSPLMGQAGQVNSLILSHSTHEVWRIARRRFMKEALLLLTLRLPGVFLGHSIRAEGNEIESRHCRRGPPGNSGDAPSRIYPEVRESIEDSPRLEAPAPPTLVLVR